MSSQIPLTSMAYYITQAAESNAKGIIITDVSTTVSGDLEVNTKYSVNGEELSVLGIATRAFENCTGITKLSLPSTIEYIGAYAFNYCTGLTECNACFAGADATNTQIPSSLLYIEQYAFCNCSNLTTLTLPSSLQYVGQEVFKECTKLTGVDADNIKYLGNSVNNYVLAFGVVDSDLIGYSIVENTPRVYKVTAIELHPSCQVVTQQAFSSLSTKLNVEGSAHIYIGYHTTNAAGGKTFVAKCAYRLDHGMTIKDSVSIILANAGAHYTYGQLILPQNLRAIHRLAFNSKANIDTLFFRPDADGKPLPNLYIGRQAFYGTGIQFSQQPQIWPNGDITGTTQAFKLPTNLRKLDRGAFQNCDSLGKLSWQHALGADVFSLSEASLYLGNTRLTSIPQNAFQDCQNLQGIFLKTGDSTNTSLQAIGARAFRGCTVLNTSHYMDLGSTEVLSQLAWCLRLRHIGESAFQDCANLASGESSNSAILPLPLSIRFVGASAFAGTGVNASVTFAAAPNTFKVFNKTSLPTITIGQQAFGIHEDTFANIIITGLAAEPKPENQTSDNVISESDAIKEPETTAIVFYRCAYGLKEFSLANISDILDEEVSTGNIINVADGALANCPTLKTVSFGRAASGVCVPNIQKGTFLGSSALSKQTALDLSGITQSIAQGALAPFQSVKSLTIPFVGVRQWTLGETAKLKSIWNGSIPSTLTTITVSSPCSYIGANAFQGCAEVTQIKLPSTLRDLREGAFKNCTKLASMEIPKGVARIADHAFYNCKGLTSVTIPNSVTSIGEDAFYNCKGLKQADVPLTYLAQVVGAATQLSTLTVRTTATNIGGTKLASLTNVNNATTLSIVAPNCKSIDTSELQKFTSLTNLTIPIIGTSYPADADQVSSMSSLFNGGSIPPLQTVTITRDYTDLPQQAFNGFSRLTDIHFTHTKSASTGNMGANAFAGCTALTSIMFGPASSQAISITAYSSIGDYAFSGCKNYPFGPLRWQQEVTIGAHAFNGCQNLTSVEITDDDSTIDIAAFASCPITTVVLPFIGGEKYTWSDAAVQETLGGEKYTFGYIFSAGETTTDEAAGVKIANRSYKKFQLPSALGTVTINTNIIPPQAFRGLTLPNIFDIVCSDGQKFKIGYAAFYGTNKLPSSFISNNTWDIIGWTIGSQAFKACMALKGTANITLTAGEASAIYQQAFFGSTRLLTLNIPGQLTKLGVQAFGDCTGINTLNIAANFWPSATLPDDVFDGSANNKIKPISIKAPISFLRTYNDFIILAGGDAKLQMLDILTNTTPQEVSASLCEGNTELQKVSIASGITSIGNDAFKDCTKLASVTFEKGSALETIGSSAFYNCSNLGLTAIEIPASVTSIGEGAFRDCEGLTSVHISDLAAWCGISFGDSYANPLYYAKKLCLNNVPVINLTIPSSVTRVKNYAFYNCESITSVKIHTNVTGIGSSAFSGCTKLGQITFDALPRRSAPIAVEKGAFNGIGTTTTADGAKEELLLTIVANSLQDYAYCSFASAADSLCARGTTRIVDANGTLYTHLHILPTDTYTIGNYAFYNWAPTYEVAVFAPEDPAKIRFGTGALAINGTIYWYGAGEDAIVKPEPVEGSPLPPTAIKSNFGLNNWYGTLPQAEPNDIAVAQWQTQDSGSIKAFQADYDYTSSFNLQGLTGKLIKSNSTEPLQFQSVDHNVNIVLASTHQVDFVGTITLPEGLHSVQIYTGDTKACKRRVITINPSPQQNDPQPAASQSEVISTPQLTLPAGSWVAIKPNNAPVQYLGDGVNSVTLEINNTKYTITLAP